MSQIMAYTYVGCYNIRACILLCNIGLRMAGSQEDQQVRCVVVLIKVGHLAGHGDQSVQTDFMGFQETRMH